MIILATGVPGAGKTLNTIKFVCEDDQFKDRPVFYFNIKEVTFDWIELGDHKELDNPDLPPSVYHWYDLPSGSVVFIDECQSIFPPRNVRADAPKHVEQLNTHRHLGIDIVLITQHPRLIDSSVRALVGMHVHYERKYGWTRVKRITFEKCQDNTDAKAARELAQIKQINFPKEYYGTYKSAELHTHKARIPLKLVLAIGFMALIPFIWYFVGDRLSDRAGGDVVPTEASFPTDQATGLNLNSQNRISRPKTVDDVAKMPLDPEEYLKLYKPRVSGIPHTAPIYDDLVQPTEVPKTLCTSYRKQGVDHCQCFTQQITRIEMSFAACKNIVNHRMWDPTLKPVTYNSEGTVIDS